MNDDFVLDGQNEETSGSVVSTMAANDALAKSGVSSTSSFMSEQIKSMLSAPDFRHSNPFMSESEIQRRSGERWILPEDYEEAKGTEYKQDEKSSAWTNAKNAAKRFAMDLFMWGNKAQIGAGQLLAKATGNKIGWEMQQRAYDCLDGRMAEMERTYERPEDLESFTGDATAGAMSMLEMYGASMATMGIAPLVQMGVDAFGGGTYNNMRKYAKEHGGSIEGYEGNWLDIGIDLTNATAQVGLEKLGFGSKRWAKGLEKPLEKVGVKRWAVELAKRISKEVPENALQEGLQGLAEDVSEWVKGNEEAPSNWRGYGRAALLGGLGGGIFGAINTNARLKMDKSISDFVVATRLNKNPGANIAQVKKEADAFAKKFNDDVEDGLVKDTWDELSKRLDANNDRGVVRDNLVEQFTNARVAALGLESAEELDAEDLADIQDAATVATGEAFRESFAFGVPIESTPTARLVAEGKDLTIRDLTPDEKGFAEKMPVDIEADRAKLAEQMAKGRDLAESRRVARERRAIEESAPTAETQAQLAELTAIREDERLPEIQTRAEEIKAAPQTEADVYDFQQKLADIAKGVVRDTGRGAYDPRYQRIILNKDSDISTILHELSHMWLNNYFKAYRNPKAPDVFKKMWKPVEKALNLREYDRYLDKRSSENFARSFEKWVMDGGKGASAEMTPVYERLSKRIADIYDGLATRYFDKVAELSPAVQNWFAKNEKIADSVMMQVPKKDKETGKETIEEKRVQYRDREKERKNAQKVAKTADKWERVGAQLQSALDKIQPNLSESGKMREHDTSRGIRDRLSAQGILDGYKNMYETESSMEVAEKVRDYVTMNPDEAFEVAMGRKNAPGDLPATMVYTAVANKLDVDGDVAKLWELQQSPIVEYRSELARELQRGRNFFQDGNGRPDIPRIVKYLNKAYENKMTDADKALLEKEVNTINDLIAKADLNFEDAWNNILSDIECK